MGQWVFVLFSVTISSILLHKYVESPKREFDIWKVSVVASTVLFLLAVSLPWAQNLFISERERHIFGAFSDRSTYRCGKLVRITEPGSISCRINGSLKNPSKNIMLVGNSHADSIKTTFARVASRNDMAVFFICLLYTSPSPRDLSTSRMPSSA